MNNEIDYYSDKTSVKVQNNNVYKLIYNRASNYKIVLNNAYWYKQNLLLKNKHAVNSNKLLKLPINDFQKYNKKHHSKERFLDDHQKYLHNDFKYTETRPQFLSHVQTNNSSNISENQNDIPNISNIHHFRNNSHSIINYSIIDNHLIKFTKENTQFYETPSSLEESKINSNIIDKFDIQSKTAVNLNNKKLESFIQNNQKMFYNNYLVKNSVDQDDIINDNNNFTKVNDRNKSISPLKNKLSNISDCNIMNNVNNQSINQLEIHTYAKNDSNNKIKFVDDIHKNTHEIKNSNYNSLPSNFIFSYESNHINDLIQLRKQPSNFADFSIDLPLEENQFEHKTYSYNSFTNSIENENKTIYIDRYNNPLNNEDNSTLLFPVFEKNLDFEIESPTHYIKEPPIDHKTYESEFYEGKSNKKLENSFKLSLNFHKFNEDQCQIANETEDIITSRNMSDSCSTNLFINNHLCFNKNIDLAKKLNFFSNEGSLLVSVDEKREIINTFGLSKIELNNSSLPVIFDYPKETETFDKFNFFESNDLKSSMINVEMTNSKTTNLEKNMLNDALIAENHLTQYTKHLNQLSKRVLYSPQNRNNITPNYANRFINTTSNKNVQIEKSKFFPEVLLMTTPTLNDNPMGPNNCNVANTNSNFSINKSELIIENTEKILFESVKRSGSQEKICSNRMENLTDDSKNPNNDTKNTDSSKTLQMQIIQTNKPKIISQEKIDNKNIKLSKKNCQISIQTTNYAYNGNSGGLHKIHSKKHIKDCKQNLSNIINDNCNLNIKNRHNSKKNQVKLNDKEIKNKSLITKNKNSKQIEKVVNQKQIRITNNDVLILSPSNILSTNNTPESNLTHKNEIDFKTNKNTSCDILSPTCKNDDLSYLKKLNSDTSKNTLTIERTLKTESSHKMNKIKVDESNYYKDSNKKNNSSKKSVLEEKVQFDSIFELK